MLGAGKVFLQYFVVGGGRATNVDSWMDEDAGGYCLDETLILKRTDVSRKYLAAHSSFLQLEVRQYFFTMQYVSSVYPRSISNRVSTVQSNAELSLG